MDVIINPAVELIDLSHTIEAGMITYPMEQQVGLVGIDSHNIDDTRTRVRPVHTILLGAEIPICEHLCNLAALPDHGFEFFAVPPKVKAFGTFPVRAYARVSRKP